MIAAFKTGFWHRPSSPSLASSWAAASAEPGEDTAELIIDNAPVALLVAELGGSIVRWNAGATKLLGIPTEEALGQNVFSLFPGLRSAVTRVREQSADRFGVSELFDCTLITPSGSLRVDIRFAPVRHADGTVSSFILLLEDIETRRMSESEAMRHVRAQHESLLREIHHRIKNHLHGVIALIRAQALQTDAGQQIETIIDQLMAISHAHGIQAESNSGHTNLAKLVKQIAASSHTTRNALVACDDVPAILSDLVLAEHASVPVALVITELVTNAVKHGIMGIIVVRLRQAPNGVAIEVLNRGQLDEVAAAGRSTGFSGLQLARSILPPTGVSLDLAQVGENVVATLTLGIPTIVTAGSEFMENHENGKTALSR